MLTSNSYSNSQVKGLHIPYLPTTTFLQPERLAIDSG